MKKALLIPIILCAVMALVLVIYNQFFAPPTVLFLNGMEMSSSVDEVARRLGKKIVSPNAQAEAEAAVKSEPAEWSYTLDVPYKDFLKEYTSAKPNCTAELKFSADDKLVRVDFVFTAKDKPNMVQELDAALTKKYGGKKGDNLWSDRGKMDVEMWIAPDATPENMIVSVWFIAK